VRTGYSAFGALPTRTTARPVYFSIASRMARAWTGLSVSASIATRPSPVRIPTPAPMRCQRSRSSGVQSCCSQSNPRQSPSCPRTPTALPAAPGRFAIVERGDIGAPGGTIGTRRR
jgi:hypothetical protein